MSKHVKYLAKRDKFIGFLDRSVGLEKSDVTQWVQNHVLSKKGKVDEITAFFEAEGELMRTYLEKGEIDKIFALVQQFNSLNNPSINKIELGILYNLLKLEQEFLGMHQDYQPGLKEVVDTFQGFVNTSRDSEVIGTWTVVQELLGSTEDNDSEVV